MFIRYENRTFYYPRGLRSNLIYTLVHYGTSEVAELWKLT